MQIISHLKRCHEPNWGARRFRLGSRTYEDGREDVMSSPNRSALPLTAPSFTPRESTAGVIYHTLNRGNDRNAIFKKPEDYDAFIHILDEAKPKDRAFCSSARDSPEELHRQKTFDATTRPALYPGFHRRQIQPPKKCSVPMWPPCGRLTPKSRSQQPQPDFCKISIGTQQRLGTQCRTIVPNRSSLPHRTTKKQIAATTNEFM